MSLRIRVRPSGGKEECDEDRNKNHRASPVSTGIRPELISVVFVLVLGCWLLSVSLGLLIWTSDPRFYPGETAVFCANEWGTIMVSWNPGPGVAVWRRDIFEEGGKPGPPWLGFSIP